MPSSKNRFRHFGAVFTSASTSQAITTFSTPSPASITIRPVVTEPAASATVSTVPSSPAEPDQWLDTEQRRRIDQLISTFENSTTEIDYAYAANIGDGRGVTAGRAGFTTATCDAAQVVRIYSEKVPENDLAGFLPELDRLCDADSDDTSGLPEADYIAAWTAAASDDAFRAAQARSSMRSTTCRR